MGDDCVWRCESVFSWIGERGDDARMGEDERGDGIDGRWWSHAPEKMGVGAKESMFPAALSLPLRCCMRDEGRGRDAATRIRWTGAGGWRSEGWIDGVSERHAWVWHFTA